ncbi:hypothetical protein [Alkalispirochaeta alkalica]|uniref:hypothetical protein n=1 Tax=Alkalispirochaeta alkalica TaxID=46356 RepID=UPI00035E2B6C|nr:hypothetical protein [Alkalispirochaeta alkalica]
MKNTPLFRQLFRTIRDGLRPPPPPPVASSLAEAILSGPENHRKALQVTPGELTWDNGFSLHPQGWNPYRKTAEEIISGCRHYRDSSLARFYTSFCPSSAAEYLGLNRGDLLLSLPPAASLPPWSLLAPHEAMQRRIEQNRKEEREHPGCAPSSGESPELLGLNRFGPVSGTKGSFEFSRIQRLVSSIQSEGYCRDRGKDIKVIALTWKSEIRYVVQGGLHRSAVLAALGVQEIPVILKISGLIDLSLLQTSPAVKSGYWPPDLVEEYLAFLFTETGWNRASRLGLAQP